MLDLVLHYRNRVRLRLQYQFSMFHFTDVKFQLRG